MRRKLIAMGLAIGVIALVSGTVAVAGSSTDGKKKLHVVEHAVTDTVIDVGDPGDSTGDLLTFHNELFDATNTSVVGHDQGDCIRIDPAAGSWECRWTNFLGGGQITVEGPFFDTATSVMSVTGGTGRYRNSRGVMTLTARSGGTEFDFAFRLIG
jgi:allene oxide cyclase-like protein